jgi:hypothetical protein
MHMVLLQIDCHSHHHRSRTSAIAATMLRAPADTGEPQRRRVHHDLAWPGVAPALAGVPATHGHGIDGATPARAGCPGHGAGKAPATTRVNSTGAAMSGLQLRRGQATATSLRGPDRRPRADRPRRRVGEPRRRCAALARAGKHRPP